ncbi:LuxR C-terminal-related transcriptional regulator [Streptomyces sp. NPDC019443]|uniref:LuxR C-terminal-related transcriptional regulator n=1 Tax=Streptomyces sp. NPDC019443 TaxID=3365061 RepID=UPI0037A1D6F4
MKVLLVDTDAASRRWMRRILEESLSYELAGETGDPAEALEISRRLSPDFVLLADEVASDAPSLVSELASVLEATVILIAVASAGQTVWLGISAGARGYLLKDRMHGELRTAMDSAQAGGTYVSPPLVHKLVQFLNERFSSYQEGFTTDEIGERLLPREYETLCRLAAGQSTDEIAESMSVATATVRAYVSRVLRKFGLRSRGEAIALAYRSGICAPGQAMSGRHVPPGSPRSGTPTTYADLALTPVPILSGSDRDA